MRSEFVDGAGVGVEDLDPFRLGEWCPDGKTRIVEIPMRIIRRKQQPVDADPLDQGTQMFRLIRLIDRLRGEPEMLAHIFGRTALKVRHLGTEALEVLIHPPYRR